MTEYIILTDSACDLPEEYVKEHDLKTIDLVYNLDGVLYGGENQLDIKAFYDKMREGCMPTTMAVNPQEAADAMREYLDQGKDVLYIAFSSGLSGSCQNAMLAAADLRESYPERKIYVVDSLCASMGQGLLVHKSIMLKEKGKTIDENRDWLEANKLHLCHQFTVNDLNHLHRGGRVSKTTAVLGTLINVKPVLHVNDEGKLISLSNVRGRKKSLQTLVANMEKTMGDYENEEIFISHGDCIEDALYVQKLIEEKFGKKKFLFSYVSAVIGSHTGPGVLALFYMGDKR